MSIERYRAEVGGDKTVWPIVVLDANGPLVYHTDHKRELAAKQGEIDALTAQVARLMAPVSDEDWCAAAYKVDPAMRCVKALTVCETIIAARAAEPKEAENG
jgi:hypothetical protein